MTEEEKTALVEKKYGDGGGELIKLFRQAWPEKDLTTLLTLDSMFRAPSQDFIEKKAAHRESPTYSYLFAYEPPYDGGKTAWHCAEIPFVFHNTCLTPVFNEPGVTDRLEDQMCDAWLAFAKTGAPGCPALPDWPACEPGKEQVMVFDRECSLRENFDKELVALHKKLAPPFFLMAEDEPIQH